MRRPRRCGASPPPAARRQPPRGKHHRPVKSKVAAREAHKPKGPLIIAISIDRQTLKVYDADGFFAEAPVSTGMRGHLTPLGVFSVIQKQKWHRSNIYSGAPMPYMQRITWSGIAMHAGVLPGYPASHGCIRMPMSFAIKLWGWTRMGARVIITPGEITPAEFTHPMLITHRPEPVPVAAVDPQKATPSPAAEAGKVDVATPPASTPVTGNIRVADGSPALPQLPISSGTIDPPAALAGAERHDAPEAAAVDASELRTTLGPAMDQPKPAAVSDLAPDIKSSDDKSAETKSAETEPAEAKPVETKSAETKPADAQQPVTVAGADHPGDPQPAAADPAKSGTAEAEPAKVAAIVPPAAKTEPVTVSPAVRKRSGPIAVFVSRKDNKIYVRQNFAPLFDAPITITASDRPLGTHVFTAEADKNDKDNFHWSVVSLPPIAHRMKRVADRGNASRRRAATAQAIAAPVPDSAADALNRISIPEDVMTKIDESLSTGSSIVVSDQGIAGGETGEGTDFIVTSR